MASRKTASRPTDGAAVRGRKGKPATKTLTPSKHGFHPRSHSPTFKRLVAASDRLCDIVSAAESSECQLSVSDFNDYAYERYYNNTSSDGDSMVGPGVPHEIAHTESHTSDSSRNKDMMDERTAHRKYTHRHRDSKRYYERSESRSESDDFEPKVAHQARRQTRIPPNQRHTSLERGRVGNNFVSSKDELVMSKEDKRKQYPKDLNLMNGAIPLQNSTTVVELEPRAKTSQPAQLHFFLPQLTDGMSESSGPITSRSHYLEQRLDLLNRRDGTYDHGEKPNSKVIDPDNNNNHRSNNNTNDENRHKPPNHMTSEGQSKSQQQQQQTWKQQKGRNPSKERVTARDLRNGHLTLNVGRQSPSKDETVKGARRQVSPLRNVSKPDKAPGRRRVSYYSREQPVYIESQMPSEVLKKQIDDFPTLVSMDYSEPESPLQVR
ncbi:uncharacterized protein LOC101857717 [Aplysia californica]|uniref:Uncharacterized protein LOC101857717 n=1 Tax=Aplysia californica TaxID=6500 RepID=A0ABM1VT17_APLCA|nr:uncharacterized protein LOC101857717 [Aplysia californica]